MLFLQKERHYFQLLKVQALSFVVTILSSGKDMGTSISGPFGAINLNCSACTKLTERTLTQISPPLALEKENISKTGSDMLSL